MFLVENLKNMQKPSGKHQNIDEIDKRMLNILSKDARISIHKLSQALHLSATPCARRLKRLEDEGFIEGYFARLNREKIARSLSVFVAVTMDKHTPERFAHFEEAARKFPEIIRMSMVTGRAEDYLLQVAVRDMRAYEEFLLGKLNRIEGVSQVHSAFEMRSVIDRQAEV